MQRLCDDELMCIKQYAPMEDIGVSNERLYDEIKLLDPTFSMTRLHYALLRWKSPLGFTDVYPLYEVLSRYKVHEIHKTPQHGTHRGGYADYALVVSSDDAKAMRGELTSIGYSSRIERYTYDPMYIEHRSLIISLKPSQYDSLVSIDHAILSHPIHNLQYRASRLYRTEEIYGYSVLGERRIPSPSQATDHAYDEDLYMAIRAIDPTIDMNVIYNAYVHKHQRENAVRDMYEIWYPYLGRIEGVSLLVPYAMDPQLFIAYKKGTTMSPLLDEASGWSTLQWRDEWVYNGPEVESMYDRIQTMLRMYYSYSIPYTEHMGTIYYES
jgi:hypothetical protein